MGPGGSGQGRAGDHMDPPLCHFGVLLHLTWLWLTWLSPSRGPQLGLKPDPITFRGFRPPAGREVTLTSVLETCSADLACACA